MKTSIVGGAVSRKRAEGGVMKRLMSPRWPAWILGLAVVFAVVAKPNLDVSPFSYLSVCRRCGMTQLSVNWKLPPTDATVFTQKKQRETPLSRVLLTNNLVGAHDHEWIFSHGGGHGVRCALGVGREILPAVDSASFARLIEVLHQQGEIEFRDKVLKAALNPLPGNRMWHLGQDLPVNATTNKTALREWIAERSEFFELFEGRKP
ncbi:MAG: hypothetical protein AB1705_02190 [Verrucomicrobiota bacterium]